MEPVFIVVDLFCGAGGTSTGFERAHGYAKVVAAVNHDPRAIQSHWLNYPAIRHFEEDVRTVHIEEIAAIVNKFRIQYPNALVILWASLECTNFSKAKGGQPRDADSRTLAQALYMHYNPVTGGYEPGPSYIQVIAPDYVMIENVVEFMSWGPLDENGKPVSRKNGADYMHWRNQICQLGYRTEWRELNSANYGAYTSRNRLFGIFAKSGLPIVWPEPTHAKSPSKHSMHGDLQKWKAVREVLDFSDEGASIFNRKKPLVDASLERIFAGLVKFVAKGDSAFISKYYSGKPAGKVKSVDVPAGTITTIDGQALVQPVSLLKYNSKDKKGTYVPPSLDEPSPVVTCQNRLGVVQAEFLVQRNGGDPDQRVIDPDGPARTITGTAGNMELVQPEFLMHYFSNGGGHSSVEEPARTLTTKDRSALVRPEFFIDKHFGALQIQSIDQPAGTIMPNDKHRLIECASFLMPTNFDNKPTSLEQPSPTITANRKYHYLVNPSHGGHASSTEAPCPVIIARQDKAPLYLLQAESGVFNVPIYDEDSVVMRRVKEFMAAFNLVDIKMRMLRIPELLRIQGFPDGYYLEGTQADRKKFIGNSVVPNVVTAWTKALAERISSQRKVA